MNTNLHDGTASDFGRYEDRDIPLLVWASLIATALLWCAWKVFAP